MLFRFMGLVCLGVIVSCVSAPVMYLKRRRTGSLTLSRRPHDYRLPWTTRIIAAPICIVYPLLGMTVVVVWAIDRLFIRHLRSADMQLTSGSDIMN